ncbi:MAG TPA: ABC transporter ATP-binding protein [Candidatus Paceibacterota bacterium]
MAKKKTLSKKDYLNGFKTIFSYIKGHEKAMNTLVIASLILAITNPIIPYITGRLLDSILDKNTFTIFLFSIEAVFFWLSIWIVVQLLTYTIEQLKNYQSSSLDMTLYASYINSGYNHLLNLPLSFHKKRKIGPIINTIQRTAGMFADIVTRVIVNSAPQFISIVIALGITIIFNYQIALIMIAGVLIYIIVLTQTISPTASIQRKIHKSWMKAWHDGHDGIDNVTTVKQMGTEDYEQSKNRKNFLISALNKNLLMIKLMQTIGLYQKLIILSTQTIVFIVSINLIKQNQMTIGELITLNSYVGMLFAPFITLGDYWRTIQNGLTSLEQSEKILKTPTEKYIPDNHTKLDLITGSVIFNNVDFSYEKKNPVLKNINFSVEPGEVVALVGKSGEGKSTLVDLLSGYNFPNKGEVLIDGVDTRKIDLKFLRSNIGIVPQEVVLFNDIIKKNIAYGNLKATDKEIETAANKAHALEFIKKFPKKWKQMVGERGVKLSVGQKQRVAIARAILRNPKILILDEPTSALDAESENYITQSFEELMKGRTTFIIAHRLSTVRRADKILVFQDGKIAEIGKHDELISRENGIYRHLYELQIGLHK